MRVTIGRSWPSGFAAQLDGESVAGAVVEPATGRVLALASAPTFSPTPVGMATAAAAPTATPAPQVVFGDPERDPFKSVLVEEGPGYVLGHGAVVIAAPLKIRNGSGSPLRVLALVHE